MDNANRIDLHKQTLLIVSHLIDFYYKLYNHAIVKLIYVACENCSHKYLCYFFFFL